MSNYLLLRDNKQSGPYTFDELKEKGLKAYDLVWVEGKSAAWRYPSEIEELSPFAPQVEEQPFDRFYKKPTQNQNGQNNNTSAAPAVARISSKGPVAATILTGDGSSSTPGRRIIYVTLPAGKTASAPQARAEREAPAPVKDTTHERYLPENSTPMPVGAFEDIPSQSNEDRRSAVEITPRITRKDRSSRVGQTLMVGVSVLALLAAGIFIGMSLNKDSLGFLKHHSLSNGRDKSPVINSPADHASQPLAVTIFRPPLPARILFLLRIALPQRPGTKRRPPNLQLRQPLPKQLSLTKRDHPSHKEPRRPPPCRRIPRCKPYRQHIGKPFTGRILQQIRLIRTPFATTFPILYQLAPAVIRLEHSEAYPACSSP